MTEGDVDEVWLVRHGETEWSRSGRHTSTTDLPLLPEGERVARGLRERLSDTEFALVLTSPRQRARVTADLAGHPEADVDPDLAEWAYGDYEGITTAEIRRLDRVIARVRAAAGPVLVFGHGHALRAFTARWLDLPVTEGRLFRLDTATVSVLGHERESPVVLRWNS